MNKVLLVDPIASEGVELLKKEGFNVKLLTDRSIEALKKEIVNVDAILVRTTLISEEVISRVTKLKIIARHGVGVDNIDIQAATERGIYVTNTPTANNISVSEHIIGFMIAMAKHMRKADIALREGSFQVRSEYISTELNGKTLGIIGLGKIGCQVGRIANNGLGMRVIGYDPYINKDRIESIEITKDWNRIFKDADFISLNVPLVEETEGLLGMPEFRMMKKTAYLINCARGQVVKEKDLILALQQRLIAGAALDVFEKEPPSVDNPLFRMDNVIVTPHMAAHSEDSLIKMATHAASEIIRVLNQQEPEWPVNKI